MNKSTKRQQKEQTVKELSDQLQKAKAIVFTNYQGMTHKQIEGLKKELKKAEADLVVTKNTLLKRALEIPNSITGKFQIPAFQKPTAALFIYNDIVAPIKELAKSIKNLKLPLIKSGIIEGRMLAETDILRLSTLPSKETLIAQVVGGMKSPIYGLHRALNWNMQKLVLTLSAIEKNKKSA